MSRNGETEMSKKQQVEKSNTPEADAEQERTHADASEAHSNLATETANAAPKRFKMQRTKAVAIPLFKMVVNVPRYFLVDGIYFTGKKIDDKKEAAILAPVTDLETGETGQIILGKVLRALLDETYPGNAYVGKKFEMCLRRNSDKAYNTYDLYEVEGETA